MHPESMVPQVFASPSSGAAGITLFRRCSPAQPGLYLRFRFCKGGGGGKSLQEGAGHPLQAVGLLGNPSWLLCSPSWSPLLITPACLPTPGTPACGSFWPGPLHQVPVILPDAGQQVPCGEAVPLPHGQASTKIPAGLIQGSCLEKLAWEGSSLPQRPLSQCLPLALGPLSPVSLSLRVLASTESRVWNCPGKHRPGVPEPACVWPHPSNSSMGSDLALWSGTGPHARPRGGLQADGRAGDR